MDFNVLVIGSGPGGYVAAIRAAQLGNKVAIVEKAELGGVCLNWGCIPTKALLRSAEVYELIKRSRDFGFKVDKHSIDFPQVIKRSRDAADRLSKGVAFLMKKNNIETVAGSAKITGKNEVEVDLNEGGKRKITADNILIATGARAKQLPGMEIDGDKVLSYREAMVVEKLPPSIAVVGAGAIGVEFAYFFRALGAEVTLIEMMPHILPIEDEEVSKELEKAFKKQGIQVYTNTRVEKMETLKTKVKLTISKDDKEEKLSAEKM
ncbi:MAG: FAD-dependent oxidoreductase, partial [Calditrichae bacterium]|nr:FAD-dependent oxidoreductase [Calditrichia bacterium]